MVHVGRHVRRQSADRQHHGGSGVLLDNVSMCAGSISNAVSFAAMTYHTIIHPTADPNIRYPAVLWYHECVALNRRCSNLLLTRRVAATRWPPPASSRSKASRGSTSSARTRWWRSMISSRVFTTFPSSSKTKPSARRTRRTQRFACATARRRRPTICNTACGSRYVCVLSSGGTYVLDLSRVRSCRNGAAALQQQTVRILVGGPPPVCLLLSTLTHWATAFPPQARSGQSWS